MGREKEGYRHNIELLNERFPEKDALTLKEVADWLGRQPRTVKKHIKFNEKTKLITKADLARQVCV